MSWEEGQLDTAEHIWLKAVRIFANGGNRAASAEAYRSLAELELWQTKVHQARKWFEKALADANAAGSLTPVDQAAYASTEGWLDLEEKHIPEAADAYERSLDYCKLAFGENHYLTGWGFLLLGKALTQEGQLGQALTDMRDGLAVLDQSLGPQNPKYWAAEIAQKSSLPMHSCWHCRCRSNPISFSTL